MKPNQIKVHGLPIRPSFCALTAPKVSGRKKVAERGLKMGSGKKAWKHEGVEAERQKMDSSGNGPQVAGRKAERQKGREAERQKGREAERQKGRKAERQKGRKAERQKGRKAERRKGRKAERQKGRKAEKAFTHQGMG